MTTKSGNAAMERVVGLQKQLTVVASLTLTGAGSLAITALSTSMPPELASNSVNFDFITANGIGTICPEFTFSGINLTTAPVIGFEILDTEAVALLGGGGSHAVGGAANANGGTWTVQANAAVVTSGTVGGVTNKGNIAGYLTLTSGFVGATGALSTVLNGTTSTGTAIFTILWV